MTAKTVEVPRTFLFDAVKILRRVQCAMEAVDNAIRGSELSKGSLAKTEFGKALIDLSDLREDVEEYSMGLK